jgi:3-polyprenyl-4-hydroxybenzoate decarboxylase
MSRSYEVDLWADDLKIVIERYKEGKKLLKDTIDILKERTNVEEMFYKTLQKVIKTPSINQPNGTLVNCWLSIRAHQDALQKQHSIVYSQLNEIVNKLVSLKNEQTKTKKNLENEANKLIKEFKTSKLNLSKAKAKFHNISKETESLNLNYNTQQNSLPPKELTKVKMAIFLL